MPSVAVARTYSEKAERFAGMVRGLRLQAGLTLQQLSSRCGLAASTISKMENGQLSPSYETILRLADGLDVDIAELFSGPPHTAASTGRRSITRRGEGPVHLSPQYIYEMHSSELSRRAFVPLVTTIKARSLADFPKLPRHDGEEFIYVLSGSIELHTEYYEPVTLGPGDSCYLDSTMGHACVSTSKVDAVVMWVTARSKDRGQVSSSNGFVPDRSENGHPSKKAKARRPRPNKSS